MLRAGRKGFTIINYRSCRDHRMIVGGVLIGKDLIAARHTSGLRSADRKITFGRECFRTKYIVFQATAKMELNWVPADGPNMDRGWRRVDHGR